MNRRQSVSLKLASNPHSLPVFLGVGEMRIHFVHKMKACSHG